MEAAIRAIASGVYWFSPSASPPSKGRAMGYESIEVAPITPRIGANVAGVTLSKPLSNRQMEELHQALAKHQVLFFRDQPLDVDAHKRFGSYFGELHIHPRTSGPEGPPEILPIHADAESKRINGEYWHSDVSCDAEPPMGSILYIKQTPPKGGDTLFASMYAAHEALSDRMKSYLEGLIALHDGEDAYRGTYKNVGVQDKPVYPRAEHPVIRTHPVTGKKALYVNRGFTQRLLGVPRDESSAILEYLYEHAENPLFQCRFRWQPNSVAFWDNRCVQHRAMWDYWPHTRSGNRVTVLGDRPY